VAKQYCVPVPSKPIQRKVTQTAPPSPIGTAPGVHKPKPELIEKLTPEPVARESQPKTGVAVPLATQSQVDARQSQPMPKTHSVLVAAPASVPGASIQTTATTIHPMATQQTNAASSQPLSAQQSIPAGNHSVATLELDTATTTPEGLLGTVTHALKHSTEHIPSQSSIPTSQDIAGGQARAQPQEVRNYRSPATIQTQVPLVQSPTVVNSSPSADVQSDQIESNLAAQTQSSGQTHSVGNQKSAACEQIDSVCSKPVSLDSTVSTQPAAVQHTELSSVVPAETPASTTKEILPTEVIGNEHQAASKIGSTEGQYDAVASTTSKVESLSTTSGLEQEKASSATPNASSPLPIKKEVRTAFVVQGVATTTPMEQEISPTGSKSVSATTTIAATAPTMATSAPPTREELLGDISFQESAGSATSAAPTASSAPPESEASTAASSARTATAVPTEKVTKSTEPSTPSSVKEDSSFTALQSNTSTVQATEGTVLVEGAHPSIPSSGNELVSPKSEIPSTSVKSTSNDDAKATGRDANSGHAMPSNHSTGSVENLAEAVKVS